MPHRRGKKGRLNLSAPRRKLKGARSNLAIWRENQRKLKEAERIMKESVVIKEELVINEEVINENVVVKEELFINEEVPNEQIVIKEELVINDEFINEEIINEEVMNEDVIDEDVINEEIIKEAIFVNEEIVNEEVINEEVNLDEFNQTQKEEHLVVHSLEKNCANEIIDEGTNSEDIKDICVDSSKCICKLMCGQGLISKKERLDIFRHFSNLPTRSEKSKFIFQNIVWTVPRKRNPNQLSTNRISNYIRLYCLPIEGRLTRVCKKTFDAILDIKAQFVNESVNKFGQLSKKQIDHEENDGVSTENLEYKCLVDQDPLDVS
ncbi:uncharacterized protein LOC117181352 isoform X3 [Belonocnema kinseyi]|uniref:uncharacterized protein LOC117181352 isoform X3 n=1 Tax=Belonocnema kinseyi TaxID=2817044 RepID=UPI00143CDEC5|nr:uncharacterized protein LOC117181352 isoform X3 [Belonocnema kinseyi]